jgi:tagaturonate reductase
MKTLQRTQHHSDRFPIRVVQFGDGNFLMGFADYIIDRLNHQSGFQAGIAVVKARLGGVDESTQGAGGAFHPVYQAF